MNEFLAGLGNIANGVLPQVAQKVLEDNGLIDKANPVTVNPNTARAAGMSWQAWLIPGAAVLAVVLAVVLLVRRRP